LSKPECAETLYKITGDIDILILNASIQYRRAWDEIADEEFDRQMTVNFKSSLKLIQKYVPYMQKQKWGRIVTVGSVQQAKPHKDMLVYAASKAAQHNMVMNLAKQLAPFNITVNNVAPGVIETPRNFEALADEEYAKMVLAGIPCGHTGEAKDCAGIMLLLCSDGGKYITGENIFIDGGMKL
jgi:NAD(P)-dependent dehydrogenase (short-subunit alcohol dehydrogenase family)